MDRFLWYWLFCHSVYDRVGQNLEFIQKKTLGDSKIKWVPVDGKFGSWFNAHWFNFLVGNSYAFAAFQFLWLTLNYSSFPHWDGHFSLVHKNQNKKVCRSKNYRNCLSWKIKNRSLEQKKGDKDWDLSLFHVFVQDFSFSELIVVLTDKVATSRVRFWLFFDERENQLFNLPSICHS